MIDVLKQTLNSRYLVWLVLFLPSCPILAELWHHERYYAEIMYESGLLATQLTILALAITPLLRISGSWKPVQNLLLWLQKRRRAIGVSAFGYATLHTLFYLREIGSLELVFLELEEPSLAIGWLAYLMMLVLAATSNTFSTRNLGPNWKKLQRTSHIVAIALFLHWWLIDQFLIQMWIWFVPLFALQMVRIAKARLRVRV